MALFSGVKGRSLSMANGLLLTGGLLSMPTAIIAFLAAAWGMNVNLPLGLGIYMYLFPALTLPSFVLLWRMPVRHFAKLMWVLTLAEPFAFYFGDRADRLATGIRMVTDPWEVFGMFFNAFTLAMMAISVLVQLAAFCSKRNAAQGTTQNGHDISA